MMVPSFHVCIFICDTEKIIKNPINPYPAEPGYTLP